ncbi:hypothetical protein TrST_g787 [Triparma strigata]|uniref:Cyclic nucleotide-binding domain-containing protein n=1 Tax=Triparma strigata TaxID=1606541 RepID=A0A9W7E8F1_9STRA|nr:hypothetical protein TrST_g787 [Triparma strigata]
MSKVPVTPAKEGAGDEPETPSIMRLKSRHGRGISVRPVGAEMADVYKSQLNECVVEDNKTFLPRGGIIVSTVAGDIQFGIPPETIKDSMKLGITVPTYFVILGEMFDRQAGLNMAEFEFPAYFNFFCLKKRVTLICMPDLEARVRAIFTETLLGPEAGHCMGEMDHGGECNETAHPNFREEGYYLDGMRRDLNVDTLIQFKTFDAKSEVSIDDKVKIKYDLFTKSYKVIDVTVKNKEVAKVEEKFSRGPKRRDDEDDAADGDEEPIKEPAPVDNDRKPFETPKFGITILGSSHGFDPNGSTTGFVIWVNGRGIMVDPPPGSSQALEKLSIPHRLIEGIILTHCHADHDAGTFQKILKEQAVKIYTTQTIFNSFMRKYSAISGFGPEFLKQLFTFHPVKIGVPVEFYGAKFNFYYSFHTIPCVGFELELDGESMCYSADTNSDPTVVEKMFAEKAIGQQRRDMLINKSPLRGDHSLIFHEAGVPPIHTPMNLLVDLDASIKSKMFVVHVTGSQIPSDSGLKQANIFDTVLIDMDHDLGTEEEGGEGVHALQRLLRTLNVLPNFSPSAIASIRLSMSVKEYPAGTSIAEEGSSITSFTIFTAGRADEYVTESNIINRSYFCGDYAGETSFVQDNAYKFTITAKTNVHTIDIPMTVLKPLLDEHSETEKFLEDIKAYARLQTDGTWSALGQNVVFKEFTNLQRKDFFNFLEPKEEFELGQSIDIQSCGILVLEGEVQVLLDPSSVEDEDDLSTYRGKNNRMDFIDSQVSSGAFLCDINSVLNEKMTYVTCEALSNVVVRRLSRGGLIQFLTRYPGLMVQLLDTRILTLEGIE